VAVLTTNVFDALQLDWSTIRFVPAGATEAHGRAHIRDVDADGSSDLLLHFRTQDTGIACHDTAAILTGETFSGLSIEGADSITVVACE
jgi:hypothetical protein